MADYQTIRYQRHGDVGTLTLTRPGKRNAQNPLMWEELTRPLSPARGRWAGHAAGPSRIFG